MIGAVACAGSESEGSQHNENKGGYLSSGRWQLTIGYRHQYSFRHFIGPVEQVNREQAHTRMMNKINLTTFQLSYQATPRWRFSVDVPVLFATRRRENAPFTFSAQGIGDISVTAQSWLWRPPTESGGNIAIGFGAVLPTGRSNVKNTVNTGTALVTQPVDFSIQPGQGGWGIVGQLQGFKIVRKSVLFFDASYIATP